MWEIMTRRQRALYLGMLWSLGMALGGLKLPDGWTMALIFPLVFGVDLFFWYWLFGGNRWRW